jgi:hypothetical protein
MSDWPPSNYPIFLALVLLAATAATLAMGDEKQSEDLAIYAYYMLVIGVAVRFFEFALPDDTIKRAWDFKMRIFSFVSYHISNKPSGMRKRAKKFRPPQPDFRRKIRNTAFRKYLETVSYISKNVAIFLSLFFLISLIYGYMIDWWAVEGYFSQLILWIMGFLALHIFTRKIG